MLTKDRIQYLDALRGFAALWVVMVHVANMPQPAFYLPEWFGVYVTNGVMGVELFFVLSAFSLCLSMPGHAKEERPLLGFALRRFFRIAPLFYLMIVVTYFFNPAGFTFNFNTLLANVFFIFNFIPGHSYQTSLVIAGWTIGVEMAFYAIFPFVYHRTRDIYKSIFAVAVALTISAIFYSVIHIFVADPGTYNMYSIFYRAPIFMFGLVAFYAVPLLRNSKNSRGIALILLGSVPVLFFAIVKGQVAFVPAYYWQGLMFACLVVGMSQIQPGFIVNRCTSWLGKISYSVYLVHGPIVAALFPFYAKMREWDFGHIATYVFCLLVTVAIVICVASLTYRLLEKPSNDWGRKVASNMAGRT
jgi:peptidoglycan/LPS O-acetylase OafA/YrhL